MEDPEAVTVEVQMGSVPRSKKNFKTLCWNLVFPLGLAR